MLEDLSILSVEKGKFRNFARKHIVVLLLKREKYVINPGYDSFEILLASYIISRSLTI